MKTIKDEILDLTIKLVSFKTTKGNIEEFDKIFAFLKDYFDGLNPIIYEYNFDSYRSIVIQNFEGKNSDVILNGHLDVVEAQFDSQYVAQIDGDYLRGRGTGDMKSGVAIMMKVLKNLLESKSNKKVCLMLTSDEEIGGFNGVAKLVKEGFTSNLVLIPDGGNSLSRLTIKQKGIYHFDANVSGIAGHASQPRKAKNPLDKIILFYNELRNEFQKEENNWFTTVTMTNMAAGVGSNNVIPDLVQAKFDLRFTEKYNLNQIKQKIKDVSEKFEGIEIIEKVGGSTLDTKENNEFVQNYKKSCEKILGEEIFFESEDSGSDGRFFSEVGIATIVQRPFCYNIHGKDERVLISDFVKLYNIYSDYIDNIN